MHFPRIITILIALIIAFGSPAGTESMIELKITPVPKSRIAKDKGLEARMLWLDATANLERFSTREGVCSILDKCVDSGINAVAVGVKSSCGFALYKSKTAPRMEAFMGKFLYPKDYDLLKVTVEEGHKRNLKVYAMVMVFSEGRLSDKSGPAYTRFKSWQSTLYDVKDGKPALFPSSQSPNGVFVFVNPAMPEVQRYELSIIKEIAAGYDVDGVVIDRCRFDGLRADFSSTSKAAFERYIGKKIAKWPDDVYTLTAQQDPAKPAQSIYVPEPKALYKKWLEWRASVITDFVKKAGAAVKKAKPNASFGSVVGCWYPEYSSEGANWASIKFHPEGRFDWASPEYYKTGYAESLDFLVPNCYGRKLYMNETDANTPYWWTVQGGAHMANEVVGDACILYAGVYVQDFKGKPDEFKKALCIALDETNGVKVFDLSQIEEYNWWHLLKEVFAKPSKGLPHEALK